MQDLPHLSLPPSVAPAIALPPAEREQPATVETIRVLHVINGEHYAGAERVQDLLAKRLPALIERKRLAFPSAAADKRGGETVSEQMLHLPFDGSEIERAIRLKGRVGGRDESGQFELVHVIKSICQVLASG